VKRSDVHRRRENAHRQVQEMQGRPPNVEPVRAFRDCGPVRRSRLRKFPAAPTFPILQGPGLPFLRHRFIVIENIERPSTD